MGLSPFQSDVSSLRAAVEAENNIMQSKSCDVSVQES